MTIRIAPSILAADFARLGAQVAEAEAAGGDLIHVDVMDGRFVPNISMGPMVVEAVRRSTALLLDLHLMIVEPERHIEAFVKAGAGRVTVHVEVSPHLHRTLQLIKSLDCACGVALNPHTPPQFLSEVMHMLDYVLVMTVNPGFGGQDFLPEMLPKIAKLRTMIDDTGRDIDLGVDGGINTETAAQVVAAGANVLIAGSSIFNHEHSVEANMKTLRGALDRPVSA